MKVIEPKEKFVQDWEYGDIVKFANRMFMVSGTNFARPFLLDLDNGELWYKDRKSNLCEFKALINEEQAVVHYPKSQYRMYLEAP